MSEEKKVPQRKKPKNYGEKLVVKGSSLDIMKAAVKDANSKSAPEKSE